MLPADGTMAYAWRPPDDTARLASYNRSASAAKRPPPSNAGHLPDPLQHRNHRQANQQI